MDFRYLLRREVAEKKGFEKQQAAGGHPGEAYHIAPPDSKLARGATYLYPPSLLPPLSDRTAPGNRCQYATVTTRNHLRRKHSPLYALVLATSYP